MGECQWEICHGTVVGQFVLEVYSYLINCHTNLFTELNLHLVCLFGVLGESLLNDPIIQRDKDFLSQTKGIANLPKDASSKEMIEMVMKWIRKDQNRLLPVVALAESGRESGGRRATPSTPPLPLPSP